MSAYFRVLEIDMNLIAALYSFVSLRLPTGLRALTPWSPARLVYVKPHVIKCVPRNKSC
jgi:hypothetical protein